MIQYKRVFLGKFRKEIYKNMLPENQVMMNLETIQNNSDTTGEPKTRSKDDQLGVWTPEKNRQIPPDRRAAGEVGNVYGQSIESGLQESGAGQRGNFRNADTDELID